MALGRFDSLPALLDAAPVPGDAVPLLLVRARSKLATARGEQDAATVLRDHLAALDLLLARGAAIDATGSVFKRRALIEARLGGRDDLAQALLARGADPSADG